MLSIILRSISYMEQIVAKELQNTFCEIFLMRHIWVLTGKDSIFWQGAFGDAEEAKFMGKEGDNDS